LQYPRLKDTAGVLTAIIPWLRDVGTRTLVGHT
jgi:hypothetical protein